jgi:hypothetical protein
MQLIILLIFDSFYTDLWQAGLFVYDIFWVFFTPVMVSVAKSFDAPIKVCFLAYLSCLISKFPVKMVFVDIEAFDMICCSSLITCLFYSSVAFVPHS